MQTIVEGAEVGDLARIIRPIVNVDKYKSKMGEDTDIIVITFSVKFKEPADDLVDFIEKGFAWVLDADVSTGELPNGDFAVFVEMERNRKAPEQIIGLISDMQSLTKLAVDKWTWSYGRSIVKHPLTLEELAEGIPLSLDEYNARFSNKEIDDLQLAAGINTNKKAPDNEFTESIRIAAGLK
ncbi:hypothetical protein UFOVP116_379 [uncultured Caudovirales phage]|uniref:Uncharacterized protein n=1 Tax=uncultured Caudovirales phage TaxID=2100421 RepID=A0A6J5LFB7_9CAUD|nr:hypothetical protein UFOVP116_379 [uncultured Caudovirales phage]